MSADNIQTTKSGFKNQLSVSFLIGVLILAIASSFLVSYINYQRERAQFIEYGQAVANALISQINQVKFDEDRLQRTVKSYLGFHGVQKIELYDEDFNVIFSRGSSNLNLQGWQGVESPIAQLAPETDHTFFYTANLLETNNGTDSQLGYFLMALDKKAIIDQAESIFFVNASVLALLGLCLLGYLVMVSKRLTAPLEKFTSKMIQAASGDIELRSNYHQTKELAQMSEAFNQMMDVIERKQGELTTSRDQALKLARVKSDFAANVSHEIRTPLNGILGMVNLLKEMGLPQHQHEYLEIASRSGDSLLQMLNDVLDFSKMESGKVVVESKDFDLNLLLEQLALLYAERAHSKDIEFCLNLPIDHTLFVRGDNGKLRQIISNLLNNAIKFTSQGSVGLSLNLVSQASGTGLVEIIVSDTGAGIPKDSHEKIFLPFYQIENQGTKKQNGTGLGLTIVEEMVRLLEGEIQVSSEVDKGTAFKLSIPMTLLPLPDETLDVETPDLSNKRLLLIEPFESTANFIQKLTTSWDAETTVCSSFDEALSLLKMAHVDQTLPDVCLFNTDYAEGSLQEFLTHIKKIADDEKIIQVIPMMRMGSRVGSFDKEITGTTIDRPVRQENLRQILLDVFKTSSLEKLEQASSTKSLTGLKILVVDDNDTNQLVAISTLSELGVHADVMQDGQQAVEAFKEHHYDLILMDVQMPIMDGFEATQTIRALDVDHQPVIFAYTANSTDEDRRNCIESGMDDVLAKPFRIQRLVELVEQHFNISAAHMTSHEDVQNELSSDVISESIFSMLVQNTGSGIEQIIRSYLIDTPIYMVTLSAAMEAGDTSSCLELAHKLKGSSYNLGAHKLVNICNKIEKKWSQKVISTDDVEPLVKALEGEFKLVEIALTHRLNNLEFEDDENQQRNKKVVLIVDDDQSTRMTIASVLEREGHQVEVGVNGREAVRLFDLIKPNVVIMDAMMPVKDGFSACKEIKELPDGKEIPVLITTALESERSVEMAYECGAADFIPKPINLSVLRQRVKRLLDKQNADQHVQKLAYKDSLTGLPNRVAFVDQLQQELVHAERNASHFAVFFIDLDQFKNVNDTLGHEAGDILLKAMAGRLGHCIRSSDMLARIGGDEFVVILSEIENDSVTVQVAETMLSSLKAPFNIADNEIFAGASIGAALYPQDGLTKDDLLKNADTAMYRAKAAGRNTYRFYKREMSVMVEQRMRMETDLRKVIDENELSLYFQPKMDTKTNKVVGSEALVRWKHALQGMVSPAEFIPVAEEVGLIREIGLWVLDTACQTLKNWQQDHQYKGSMAVNVSAVQMADENFVNNVAYCLDKYSLEPSFLEIEVTETMVLENADAMIEKLKLVRQMGVNIAIDDFGTGYSSFNYLKQLPANALKLDMEFIHEIPKNEADNAVVDGMIVLAHNLGLKVVAEGVETQEQYEFLKSHHCDLVQGYLIDKPLEVDDFVKNYVAIDESHRLIDSI